MKIYTENTFDDNGVFPLRTIEFADLGKAVRTPTAAHLPGKRLVSEGLHPDARGIAELVAISSGR